MDGKTPSALFHPGYLEVTKCASGARAQEREAMGVLLLVLEAAVALGGIGGQALALEKGPSTLVRNVGGLVLSLASQKGTQGIAIDVNECILAKVSLGDTISIEKGLDLSIRKKG